MINVFILCKNDFFFRTIERILNDGGICIAGICKKPQTAVEEFINSKADLVVMDANWPDYSLSGKEIVGNFLMNDINTKIIFVTAYYEPRSIQVLTKAGAKGYFFLTAVTIERITSCIENVFFGAVDIS